MSHAGAAHHSITTILVPIDFSEYSQPVLSYAEMLAKAFDAKVILIHVIETVSYTVTESVQWKNVYTSLEAMIQPMLDQLVHGAEKRGVVAEGKLIQGLSYDQIVKTADATDADLIVMGTHGRTGMLLLLGSVAERVVRLAHCPVLTVRGRRDR